MANKPINRFEVQATFDDGGFLRWTSRRTPPLGRAELADKLEEIAAMIRDFEQKVASSEDTRETPAAQDRGEP